MTDPKNMLDVLTEGREMPDGCDTWAFRSVHPDLRSSRGFRWPLPGNWAECDFDRLTATGGGCPHQIGDGVCVATTYAGMASGGIPAITLLLCAYNSHDVLGHEQNSSKLRASRVFVVDVIDGARLLREYGADLYGADLHGANLYGADLYGADLHGADLSRANLYGANLDGADLYGANLYGANLHGANLHGANLPRANLSLANLYGANLTRANLYGANLTRADLTRADLTRANLYGANLYGADLYGADLTGADLTGADLTGANLSRVIGYAP